MWETASALAGDGLLRVEMLTVLLLCADDTFLALVLVSVQSEGVTVHGSCQVGLVSCPLTKELVTSPPSVKVSNFEVWMEFWYGKHLSRGCREYPEPVELYPRAAGSQGWGRHGRL